MPIWCDFQAFWLHMVLCHPIPKRVHMAGGVGHGR